MKMKLVIVMCHNGCQQLQQDGQTGISYMLICLFSLCYKECSAVQQDSQENTDNRNC